MRRNVRVAHLFAIDHHRGSDENQSGWEHHDISVVDERVGKMDTLPFFRAAIHDADLESSVFAVVGKSAAVAAHWTTPLGLLFIDGGHGEEPARLDYEGWAMHVMPGGILAIHDVFPDPADGGRPPYEQIYVPAIESGNFAEISATGSLRILRRAVAHAAGLSWPGRRASLRALQRWPPGFVRATRAHRPW